MLVEYADRPMSNDGQILAVTYGHLLCTRLSSQMFRQSLLRPPAEAAHVDS